MIKKLFTLLTLALLAMPLAWGADYYLVGSFTNWEANAAYKFTESGPDNDIYTYTLTVDLTAPCQFKIYNGNWYGAHNQIFEFKPGQNFYENPNDAGGAPNFELNTAGITTFTFKYRNNGVHDLTVTREPKLSLEVNDGAEEAMTATSTGWTISRNLSQGDKFRFIDEWKRQRGWNGDNDYTVHSGLLGTTIPIAFGVKVFYMNETIGGNYVIDVNSALDEMVINQVESKSLANIQSSGVVDKFYTVNEDLQVVFINSTKNFAIARNTTVDSVSCTQGYKDFMRYSVTSADDKQPGSWQKNNWVMLDFTGTTWLTRDNGSITEGETIIANTLKGVYTDNENYTIKVHPAAQITCNTSNPQYTPNVYCPANFYGNHTQTGNGVTYWFMTPQPMEYCKFTFAMYYAGTYNNVNYAPGFYMANGDDDYALNGGVGIEMNYNSNPQYALTNGASYRFNGVIMQTGQSSGSKDHYPQDPDINSSYKVAALNLGSNGSAVITAVSEVKTGSEVVSVTYCDLAGRMSQKPFAGVNIIVTRYSDGTVKTTKVIK